MSSEKRKLRLFIFCYDITNVVWRFSPEREREREREGGVTLQTSCGAERVNSQIIFEN